MMSGVLLFLAGLAVAVCQGVTASGGINKSVVCINNDMTLELTILRGEDGKIGRPGLKGVPGDGGFGQGEIGVVNRGEDGPPGPDGRAGIDGEMGDWGETGNKGPSGPPGISGMKGIKGEAGEPGKKGQKGETGSMAELGLDGDDGDPGPDGLPLLKDIKDLLIHALNDYQVTESGYYNNIYHVTSRDLTDGRTDTGGWGSETAKTGNYIQATFLRPVYVTSVTVAGGFVPSCGHDIRRGYGKLKLEYSADGNNWKTSTTFPSPMVHKMVTLKFTPVIAQYWRLISSEDKWVGTTEFALEPLIKT